MVTEKKKSTKRQVPAKKRAGAVKKKTSTPRKRAVSSRSTVKKVPIQKTPQETPQKSSASVARRKSAGRTHQHRRVIQQMLEESSPRQQRVMLRRCISSLYRVASLCRQRSAWRTIGLLFVGAVLGITIFIATTFAHARYGYLLSRFAEHIGVAGLFSDVPVARTAEEIDLSFRSSTRTSGDDQDSVDLREFWEVWGHIERDFVPRPERTADGVRAGERLKRNDLLTGAVKGLAFATQDQYTNFFLPKDAHDFENEVLNGEIEGIGAYLTIDKEKNLPRVVRPIADGPADRAGLLTGDIIAAVDGVETSTYNLSEAVDHIRGPRGTTVLLDVYRPLADETLTISVVRDTVEIPTVTTDVRDGVFVITLSTFTKATPKAFRAAIEEFVSLANANGPRRILLDMRGNMGGILSVSVYVAGLFLPEDSAVLYEYSGTEKLKVYKTNGPIFRNGVVPIMTVLVDGSTASASEILAAALRDYGIADIVGTRTLGKGSVQTIRPIGADDALLKMTVAHWLTPNKESIEDEGVVPDVDYLEDLQEMYKQDPETDFDAYILDRAVTHLREK